MSIPENQKIKLSIFVFEGGTLFSELQMRLFHFKSENTE